MNILYSWKHLAPFPNNTLTLAPIMLISHITFKETRNSQIGKNYDILAYHNYIIDYPK